MVIIVNGVSVESNNPELLVDSAIRNLAVTDLESIREWATKTVNDIDVEAAEKSGTITGTLSMVLRYTDNALRVKMWNDLGRPDPPDQFLFATAYTEGTQFVPPYTAKQMLEVWELAWEQMSNEQGRPLRRAALERIKTAESVEEIAGILTWYIGMVNQAIGQ